MKLCEGRAAIVTGAGRVIKDAADSATAETEPTFPSRKICVVERSLTYKVG